MSLIKHMIEVLGILNYKFSMPNNKSTLSSEIYNYFQI